MSFSSLILQYISLCQKKVPFLFVIRFCQPGCADWTLKAKNKKITWRCSSTWLVSERQFVVKNSQKWLRFGCKIDYKKQQHYNGHLEQPHSRAVSISSEYEVPSVQRKTTFLLLVLVTPQHTPVGAAAWQDRGQSMRGILLVDVHVLRGWWRFSCSLTISPWHVNSGHEMRWIFTDFNWSLWFQSPFSTDVIYLSHRWARCILVDSDRRVPHSLKRDTPRSRSAALCRLEAPAVDHSTDPGSLRCTCSCRSLPLEHTARENIWRNDETLGQSPTRGDVFYLWMFHERDLR